MYRSAVDGERGFVHGLGECGMGMDGSGNVFRAAIEFHGEDSFSN
jgi:hypothetical protein